jgi:hypothetical protein
MTSHLICILLQMMWWIAVTLKTDRKYMKDQQHPGEREQDELAILGISALVQAFLYVVAAVYVVDHSEYVAKRLEAAAPRAPADLGAYSTSKFTTLWNRKLD